MTTWRDHPQHHRGYLFLLQPTTVFAAQLDYTTTNASGKFGATGIWRYLFVDNITTGDVNLTTVVPGMTVLLGSAPGLDDRGRTYVRSVPTISTEKVIAVWASNNIHDGELAPDSASTNYITVLDDYRVWLKPPYYDSATGLGYFNGTEAANGTTYACQPTANGGPGWAGFADPDTGVARVEFSALNSYSGNPRAALGEYYQPALGASSSEGTPANAVDGNPATYWETTGVSGNITVSAGDPRLQLRKYSITAFSDTTAPKSWQASYGGVPVDKQVNQTGWSAGETRTFYLDRRDALSSYLGFLTITVLDNNGAATTRIAEIALWHESPFGDIRVTQSETGATASSEAVGHPATEVQTDDSYYWEGTELPAWVEFQFASAITVTDVQIKATLLSYPPTAFAVQVYWDEQWITVEEFTQVWSGNDYTFKVAFNGYFSTRWRLYITEANGGSAVQISCLEMSGYVDDGLFATWNVKDGTIVEGSANAVRIMATFPPGFRWVDLTVTDTNSATHTAHIPVFVAGPEYVIPERPDGTATSDKPFDVAYPLSQAFDKNDSTLAQSDFPDPLPVTITFEVADPMTIRGYIVMGGGVDLYPTAWTFQYWDSAQSAYITVDTQSAQNTLTKQTYLLPSSVSSTRFRWVFTADVGSWFYLRTLDFVMRALPIGNSIDPITNFEITNHVITAEGQEMTFLIHEPIALSDYPDGTLVMYWEDEWIGGVKGSLSSAGMGRTREHMRFIGWIDTEPSRLKAEKHDTHSTVELACVDVGGRLRRLPGFNTVFERQQETTPTDIHELHHANLDRIAHVIARHMTTAPDVTDFVPTGHWDLHWVPKYLAQGHTLWEMLDNTAQAVGHNLVCDKSGALRFLPDQILLAKSWRTDSVQAVIDECDWVEIQRTRTRPPRYHWNWASAINTGYPYYPSSAENPTDSSYQTTFVVAPGFAPGQGASSNEIGEQLISSHYDLTTREGNRYAARLNQPESLYRVVLAHGADVGIDPALKEWVTLTVTAATADERGVTLDAVRFLPYRVEIGYDHRAGTKTVTVEMEREVVDAIPAQVYTPPE